MKKLFIAISLFLITILLVSCANKYTIRVEGFESFHNQQSDYELNVCLFPSDDFPDRFAYTNIDYYYRENLDSYFSYVGDEQTLVVIAYDQSTYESAKNYCLENMTFSEEITIVYDDFVFLENIELAIGQGRYSEHRTNTFPHYFNMFAYNDVRQSLYFLGFYSPDYSSEDIQATIDNWPGFLQEYFPECDWTQRQGGGAVYPS